MTYTLEIPRTHKHLLTQHPITRLYFDFNERIFKESLYQNTSPSEEVYEWLIETVGYEFTMFRKLDGFFYDRNSTRDIANTKIKNSEEWEKINPILPADKGRTWSMADRFQDAIIFETPDLAALFKLRWL